MRFGLMLLTSCVFCFNLATTCDAQSTPRPPAYGPQPAPPPSPTLAPPITYTDTPTPTPTIRSVLVKPPEAPPAPVPLPPDENITATTCPTEAELRERIADTFNDDIFHGSLYFLDNNEWELREAAQSYLNIAIVEIIGNQANCKCREIATREIVARLQSYRHPEFPEQDYRISVLIELAYDLYDKTCARRPGPNPFPDRD